MKRLLFATFVMCAGFTFAQRGDLASARQMMASGLQNIGQEAKTTIFVSGKLEVGGEEQPIYASAATQRVAGPQGMTVYLDLRIVSPGKVETRLVADGTNLWIYDVLRHQYSVWPYYQAKNPNHAMLMFAKSQLTDFHGIMLQTLIEADEAASKGTFWLENRWNPWMPTGQTTVTGNEIHTVAITPHPREITYKLARVALGDYSLNQYIYRYELVKGGKKHILHITGQVYHNELPDNANFTFEPGTAKPVPLSKAQGGG